MSNPMEIRVEVIYALPQTAVTKVFRLASAATVGQVLRLAAGDPAFAQVDMANATAGVFGKIAIDSQILEDGDRVEIYRSLAADPKIARRARAKDARRKP